LELIEHLHARHEQFREFGCLREALDLRLHLLRFLSTRDNEAIESVGQRLVVSEVFVVEFPDSFVELRENLKITLCGGKVEVDSVFLFAKCTE
jgi:hypothetical protein